MGPDGGPCTVTPLSESATIITGSPYDVMLALLLPMELSEFDDSKKSTFRSAISAAAGVSNADVTIVTVESISGARRGAIIHTTRRLLAASIRIDISIKAANQNAADTLGVKLTVTAINAQLQKAGLPAATILETAKTTSGDGSSTGDGAASGGMLPAIIGAAAGIAVLTAIAFFVYRRYKKTRMMPHQYLSKNATSISDLASVELGTCPPTAPTATSTDIEAYFSIAGPPTGQLCVECGTMNEVWSDVCQDCHKLLQRKDVAGLLFEQVALYMCVYIHLHTHICVCMLHTCYILKQLMPIYVCLDTYLVLVVLMLLYIN